MGTSRSRSRSATPIVGGRYWSVNKTTGAKGVVNNGPLCYPFTEITQDVVDRKPYPDHIFVSKKIKIRPAFVSGIYKPQFGSVNTEFDGYAMPPYTPAHIDYPPNPNMAYYLTKMLASINPSKPVTDLPVFLFELKDFPHMLKGIGDVLARRLKPSDVAGGYLAYQFGWRPLFNDLWSLWNLQRSIDQRVKQLQGYARGQRVRRKLGKTSSSVGSKTFLNPRGAAQLIVDQIVTETAWGTARVRLGMQLPSGSSLQSLAMRQVLGLNLSAAAIWEAIPWSWLIDYFANIGDVLGAHRGWIPYSVDHVNIMCHSELKFEGLNRSIRTGFNSTEQISGGDCSTELKNRSVPLLAVPTFQWKPFFGPSQVAILTSLVTSRSLRSVGK